MVVAAALIEAHVPRECGVAIAVAMVGAAWFRPDPLAPVPEVEGIFQLAWASSPFVAILAVVALGAAALTPGLVVRAGDAPRRAALPLVVYFAVSALAPALGAFPAPLVGMGVSPILGAWLGVGLLAALASGRLASSPAP